eukprot:2460803-Rhodomonas_salina.1
MCSADIASPDSASTSAPCASSSCSMLVAFAAPRNASPCSPARSPSPACSPAAATWNAVNPRPS